MVYGYVDSPDIGQLSRYVREWEAGPDDEAPEVNLWKGNADEAAHPLVLELNNHEKDAVPAALAYMAEGSESDVPALIRWMMDGGFKGLFDNEEAFARDQFGDAFADHIEGWDKRQDIGFPFDLDMVEAVDWEYIGEQLAYGDTWCFVAIDAGVYVFDVSISIDDYRVWEEPPSGGCQWFAKCTRPAEVLVPHPILGQVAACQPCADFATS